MSRFINSANYVIQTELASIEHMQTQLDQTFEQACELLMHATGKIVVIGMGKSGHIGRKIAASLASTGSAAFFVHPAEASHGDLGMISASDPVLLISNSGETQEVLALLPILKRQQNPLIAMTGQPQSTLAKEADVHLNIASPKEACRLNLAPTCSTTNTLVMGDAIAIALQEAKGFDAESYARSHPGGSLGKRLLLRVSDLMHQGEQLIFTQADALLTDALVHMSSQGKGMIAVVDAQQRCLGLFTDGDLRRVIDSAQDLRQVKMHQVMTTNPKCVAPTLLAAEALALMQSHRINGLLVTDLDQRVIGMFNLQDLIQQGVY